MKNTCVRLSRARLISGGFVVVSVFAPLIPDCVRADGADDPPVLEFASGLPGKQVRLSWAGETGVRYAVERSIALASGWEQVALVEGQGPDTVWLDPVATTQKAF